MQSKATLRIILYYLNRRDFKNISLILSTSYPSAKQFFLQGH